MKDKAILDLGQDLVGHLRDWQDSLAGRYLAPDQRRRVDEVMNACDALDEALRNFKELTSERARYEDECAESGEVPCCEGRTGHSWVVSDENDNLCYCEYCGCVEY